MSLTIKKILNKIKSLEEKTKDSGWVTATLQDGVEESSTGHGGFKGIRYKKVGNRVYVEGSVSVTWDGSDAITATTLPERI